MSGILRNALKNLPIYLVRDDRLQCEGLYNTLSKIEMSMDGAGFKHLALEVILSELFQESTL